MKARIRVMLGSLWTLSDDSGMEEMKSTQSRKPPEWLKRALFEESGYRCAVPTCKTTTVLQMAHITPWSEVLVHEFENMIVLCSHCHGLFDVEKKIPERSIRNFKMNLAVVNGRYNDFERRMFDQWQEQGLDTPIRLEVGGSTTLNTRNVVGDGLVFVRESAGTMSMRMIPGGGIAFQSPMRITGPDVGHLPRIDMENTERVGGHDDYLLTPQGREFVERLFRGEEA